MVPGCGYASGTSRGVRPPGDNWQRQCAGFATWTKIRPITVRGRMNKANGAISRLMSAPRTRTKSQDVPWIACSVMSTSAPRSSREPAQWCRRLTTPTPAMRRAVTLYIIYRRVRPRYSRRQSAIRARSSRMDVDNRRCCKAPSRPGSGAMPICAPFPVASKAEGCRRRHGARGRSKRTGGGHCNFQRA